MHCQKQQNIQLKNELRRFEIYIDIKLLTIIMHTLEFYYYFIFTCKLATTFRKNHPFINKKQKTWFSFTKK